MEKPTETKLIKNNLNLMKQFPDWNSKFPTKNSRRLKEKSKLQMALAHNKIALGTPPVTEGGYTPHKNYGHDIDEYSNWTWKTIHLKGDRIHLND